MNTAPGLIHKLDADIINIIHKRNTFIDYDLTDKQATELMATLNCLQYKKIK